MDTADGYIDPMVGGCGSGSGNDCKGGDGNKHNGDFDCATTTDITVGTTAYCSWRYGDHGTDVVCPSGYLAAGMCGSGYNANCANTEAYSGVYCCPYVDNRQ